MKDARPPIRTLLRDGVDDARLAQVWQRVKARRRSRLWTRRVLVPALITVGAAVAAIVVFREPPQHQGAAVETAALRFASGAALVPAAAVEVAEHDAPRSVSLSDGTRITISAGGRLVPRVSTSERLELTVERGRARFEVQPQRGRRFVVSAGALSVEVVGTAFSVTRAVPAAEVAVEHGRVRVRAAGLPGGERLLGAGESLHWTPQTAVHDAPVAPSLHAGAEAAQALERSAASVTASNAAPPAGADKNAAAGAHGLSPAFRAAAQNGDYSRAYALLGPSGYARAVRTEREIDALLQLADVARGAAKPRSAALALARIIELYPAGDRSALAALTLGRLQLDVLAQPAEAARSLRTAIATGLPVGLQEDALARLVDASARAGQHADAESAAAQYRSRFPKGRWRTSVEQWVNRRLIKRTAAFSRAVLFIAASAFCAIFDTAALASLVQAQATEPPSAPPRTTVLVAEQTCTPPRYEPDAVWKALQVELGELGVNVQRSPADDAARAGEAARSALALITIGCAADSQSLWLRVSDAASGKELTRTLDASGVAQAAQPRALALAAVALLESSWSEIITQEARPSQSGALPATVEAIVRARLSRKLAVEEPPPLEPVVPTPAVDTVSQTFEALVTLRGFAGRSTGLLGLQLGVLPELTDSLRLVISAEALWGRSELSDSTGARAGVVQLYWLTAGGGLSWHTNSQVEVEAGPRMLVGYGLARPEATDELVSARDASGAVLTVLLAASLRAPLGSVLLITGFDVGYTLVGVVFLGDQAHLSGMADVTFGIRNGLAW